ncbi:hypothetical protein N7468_004945 [Penicillium chermesinum]|uniref:Uncharacterized protein n=1 Tax=Penicillium chermesinum TaxID=63820 RepID=A0A9W9NY94_9EURO|nr:uncharacterized protein N7468_004945 [Penicillium chermesinum]KAJ5231989.1 hypothetical protein N7468_004945 [Penicillium chermesinum]KAJ6171652.1 hypothetical protein N7470_000719 [Penicillium chermesinum]
MSNPQASRRNGIRPSQYTFGIQALPLLVSGVYTLVCPGVAAKFPNSPMQGLGNGTIQALSLTSISLGTFYGLAAYQNNIPMMLTAIPGRLLAMFVFHRAGGGWKDVAPFEGAMALLTAIGLYWSWATEQPVTEKEE